MDETVDPIRDIDIINLELILADIAQVRTKIALQMNAKLSFLIYTNPESSPQLDKRMEKIKKDKKLYRDEIEAIGKLLVALGSGIPARLAGLDDAERAMVEGLQLLSMKKVEQA